MELTFANIVLVAAGVLTALQAGLMYDFNVDIVPSLRSIKPSAHILMSQAINEKIQNPGFFLSFFGSVVFLVLAAYLHRGQPQFGWLVAASLLQFLGNVGITAAGNIPLNNRLAEVDAEAVSETEADRLRTEYQGPGSPWMRFHAVRTLSSITATAMLFLVCLSK